MPGSTSSTSADISTSVVSTNTTKMRSFECIDMESEHIRAWGGHNGLTTHGEENAAALIVATKQTRKQTEVECVQQCGYSAALKP